MDRGWRNIVGSICNQRFLRISRCRAQNKVEHRTGAASETHWHGSNWKFMGKVDREALSSRCYAHAALLVSPINISPLCWKLATASSSPNSLDSGADARHLVSCRVPNTFVTHFRHTHEIAMISKTRPLSAFLLPKFQRHRKHHILFFRFKILKIWYQDACRLLSFFRTCPKLHKLISMTE